MPKNTITIVNAAKKRFRVKYYGKNGEVLAVSEVLNNRKNCHKNVEAMRKLLNDPFVETVDVTGNTKSWPE